MNREEQIKELQEKLDFKELLLSEFRDNMDEKIEATHKLEEELSKLLKLKGLKLWSAQKLLIELGLLVSEKDGRRLIFKKANNSFKIAKP